MSGNSSKPEKGEQKPTYFPRERRVDLYYLVTDLLPGPSPDGMGGVKGGEHLFALEELLKRRLSRLSLGQGGVKEIIKNFILQAPEEELLTLIEVMPLAQMLADERDRSPFPKDTRLKMRNIMDAANRFLEEIACPARFRKDGSFDHGGFASEYPQSLLKLPNQESLTCDIDALLMDQEIVGVIFIDLDRFKMVNDRFDHAAGDRCLEAVVEIVGAVIAQKGKLYRYGGDEFAVVLPNFSADEAAATAERIRRSIDEGNPGGEVKITASIGVASSDERLVKNAQELIGDADRAMYVAKNSGGNRVSLAWLVKAREVRPLFEIEFLDGKYVVYISERGDSPFVDVSATLRIHNRKSSTTTVWCETLKVKLDGMADDFDLPELKPTGARSSALEKHEKLQVGATSTIDINLYSRKRHLDQIPEPYLSGANVQLMVVLKETFGASQQVEGKLTHVQTIRRN